MKSRHNLYQKILVGLTIWALMLVTPLCWPIRSVLARSNRVSPDLEAALIYAYSPARVIIALRPEVGVSVQQIAQARDRVLSNLPDESFRLIHQYEILPGLVGEVTQEGLESLLNQPEVMAVTLDLPVEVALTESAALINADDVWRDFGFTGAGINVAVLDTGVDPTHADLAANIVAQHCFNRSGCPPDEAQESDSAQDTFGHGTHIAGIIAGRGTTGPPGIASEAGIVAVRVLGSSGSGFTSDVLAGIEWVVANQTTLNVKVINLSLGGGTYSGLCDQADANTRLYAAAVETAQQAGITIFAASGNSGQAEAMMSPACVSGVVAVGNVYDTALGQIGWPTCVDKNITTDQVACSSNSSSALDLLAPGVLIRSTNLGGGQSTKSGTSMSTAHASAVAALMLQANPDLTPLEIEAALKETGVLVSDSRNSRITARIDALAAVARVTGTELITISGAVLLQGRTGYSNSRIFLSQEACPTAVSGEPAATTGLDGSFEISLPAGRNYQCLQAVQPGYLIGQQSAPAGDLGVITLPGGDVTGDGTIDIFDLALIASHYNSNDPTADINASGRVDLLDLVIVAGNYKQSGPIPWPGN